MSPEPDAVLGGRYALIRRIAVGGMGEVWEATDTLLDRSVAVKILKEEIRSTSTFLARFRAEARHAGQLSHSGIATVFDYGETDDLAFLVMELVRGQPLSELILKRPELPTRTRLSILAQAADALHAAHEAGVVHRDVKPGNLMVRDDGIVKVTDFGIARALTSASLTDHGQMIGTPAYVSPEQATGAVVDGASDIYSLAVVAYELFAGRPPFERDTSVGLAFAHVNDQPPPLPDTVPRGVAELIESALAKDPSQRPASAADFAAQMRREMAEIQTVPAQASKPVPTPTPTTTFVSPTGGPSEGRSSTLVGPVAARRRKNPSYVAVVAFAALLVLMGGTVWAVSRPGPTVDETQPDLSVASTTGEPAVAPPTSPVTRPPATEPLVAEPIVTEPPATEPPATEPPVTEPPATEPIATPPPPIAASPPAASTEGEVGERDAVAFVVDYYERLRDGEYATTWESLSPEFRNDRNLTFERYAAYWQNTSIELRDLRFFDGPGADESRVRFDARYVTGSGIVNETDEITLRQQPDGRLIITEQRIV